MKDIKDFKNKYGLSGLHSRPTGYMDFEDKTEEVFNDVEFIISQTREETIREIEEMLPKEEIIVSNIVDYQVEYLRGRNKMLEEIKQELNKLKK